MLVTAEERTRRIETAHPSIVVIGTPAGVWDKIALRCKVCGYALIEIRYTENVKDVLASRLPVRVGG